MKTDKDMMKEMMAEIIDSGLYSDWVLFNKAIDKVKEETGMSEDAAIVFVARNWDYPGAPEGFILPGPLEDMVYNKED